ncbi:MAG: DUF4302 domain-containing protein [Bacteroidales bacterium]|nr:DUF4302 domain-containing protein [Bacteroidales bacterium]
MKLNTSFAILFAAALLLPLTSCLKEQADSFATPSSQRLQNYLENVRNILKQPKNGWALSYYPGSSAATCYMGVVFGAQQVTAYGQDDPTEAVTSSYKLTTDDGAVLSFDTYNTVLHYYATASSDRYQARGGDFEFDIVSVSKERIVLRGKRSRNLCYLDPLPDDQTPTAFLTEMAAAKTALNIVSFSGEVTGGLVDGYLDGVSNTLSIGRRGAESSEMVSARYMIVPGGIHINEPFTFQGVTFQDFEYKEDPNDPAKGTFTGSGISFDKVIPEGYVPYNQYLGKWNFIWYTDNRSFPVELVQLEEGVSFKMKGLSEYFEPVLIYNSARGQLTWNAQAVGSSGSVTVWLAGWDLINSGGGLSWDESLGIVGVVEDNTVEELVLNWEDNGDSDYIVDSWILWGVNADGSSAGSFSSWTMASGSYQLPYIQGMVKIVE